LLVVAACAGLVVIIGSGPGGERHTAQSRRDAAQQRADRPAVIVARAHTAAVVVEGLGGGPDGEVG